MTNLIISDNANTSLASIYVEGTFPIEGIPTVGQFIELTDKNGFSKEFIVNEVVDIGSNLFILIG